MVLAANPTKPFSRHFPHQYPKQRIMIHKKFLTTIAVTLASAAAPAIAAAPYTSSAPPAPALEEVDKINSQPLLLDTFTSENGITAITYGTLGFLSTLESDGNLYVERIFVSRFYERGAQFATMSSLSVIDCGRMLTSDRVRVISPMSGARETVSNTPWRSFGSATVYAKSCEAAAIERGGTWSFSAGQ